MLDGGPAAAPTEGTVIAPTADPGALPPDAPPPVEALPPSSGSGPQGPTAAPLPPVADAPPPSPAIAITTNVTISPISTFVIAANADQNKGGPPISVDDIINKANQACPQGSTACTSQGLDLSIPGSFWGGDQNPRPCDGTSDQVRCGTWSSQGSCTFSFDGMYAREDIRQSMIGLLRSVLVDQYANKPTNNFVGCLQLGLGPFQPDACKVSPAIDSNQFSFTPGFSMPAQIVISHFLQLPGSPEPGQGASLSMKAQCQGQAPPADPKCPTGTSLGTSLTSTWLGLLAPELTFARTVLGTVSAFCS